MVKEGRVGEVMGKEDRVGGGDGEGGLGWR